MLLAGSRFINLPVMGLQTGTELARTTTAIIDPRSLEIVAYEVEGPLLDATPSLIRIKDVREFSEIGLIIDSSDEFVEPADIVRLKEIYELHFSPIDRNVRDERHRKLGKVTGYTVETTGFVIQQLAVSRPLFKRFNDTQLLIHRSQIIEINDHEIIVAANQAKESATSGKKEEAELSYVNPFRNSRPQPEHVDRD